MAELASSIWIAYQGQSGNFFLHPYGRLLWGKIRGYSLAPLYKTVPKAALGGPVLYQMLALIDALRDARSRERQLAEPELKIRLKAPEYAER